MLVVPAVTPDNTPVVSTVATDVELEVQVPFNAESVRFRVPPMHAKSPVPIIVEAGRSTFNVILLLVS